MSPTKKHYTCEIEIEPVDAKKKVLNLLQFCRKAGQLVFGFEACKKNIANGTIQLLLLTEDIANNTEEKMMHAVDTAGHSLMVAKFSNQEELSSALGLPLTGIIGIMDKNFTRKIQSYLTQ